MASISYFVESLLVRFGNVTERSVAAINLALGVLIAVANGSALLMTLRGNAPELVALQWQMTGLSIAGAVMVVLSLPILLSRAGASAILRAQAIVLVLFTIALVLFGLDVVSAPPASRARFTWSFGLMSLLGGYSGLLVTRAFMAGYPMARQAKTLAIWFAFTVALDLLIAARAGS